MPLNIGTGIGTSIRELAETINDDADFFDPALFHHDDLVGGQNGGEPVRNRDHGAALRQPFERELDLLFRFGVERGGGFVEEENGRVLEQRPGDGEALLLSAGKETAFVADERLVALRLGHDEVVRVSGLGRGLDFLLGRIEPAELDVLAEWCREREKCPARRARCVGEVISA